MPPSLNDFIHSQFLAGLGRKLSLSPGVVGRSWPMRAKPVHLLLSLRSGSSHWLQEVSCEESRDTTERGEHCASGLGLARFASDPPFNANLCLQLPRPFLSEYPTHSSNPACSKQIDRHAQPVLLPFLYLLEEMPFFIVSQA